MKAYKYKLRTNKVFVEKASRTLDLCRELYNASLQERRDAWKISHVSISYCSQADQLPQIKEVRPEFADVHSQVLQDVLRRSDKAFANFFRRCRKGENPGYPRFKPASFFSSFTYPQSGFGLKVITFTCQKSARAGCASRVRWKGGSRPARSGARWTAGM